MKTLQIFDLDETLFRTTAKVRVLDAADREVCVLDSHKYVNYQRLPGERYDYSQFVDAALFFHTSTPITPIINELKICRILGDDVVIATARQQLNNLELFRATLLAQGIPRDVPVLFSGNLNIQPTSRAKALAIELLLQDTPYRRVTLFDDAPDNLKTFLQLSEKFPNTHFRANLVRPDAEVIMYGERIFYGS